MPRAIFAVVTAAVTMTIGLWVLWHPLLHALADGLHPAEVLKDYYLPDQLSYLAIVADVRHGYFATVEPFTVTGRSIYPSLYYVVVGKIARALHLEVLTAWNLIGMIVSFALMSTCGAISAVLSRRSNLFAAGPVALLIGT